MTKLLPIQRILCPTDFSDASQEALHKAGELADHFGAELCVLHVVEPIGTELGFETEAISGAEYERRADAENKVCGMIGRHVPQQVNARVLVRSGNAAFEIERAVIAENTDLIVIATHGTTGWRHLAFGSVTEKVLRHTDCLLLVVHAPRP